MELFQSVVSTIWTELHSPTMTLPIININIVDFLIGVFVLKCVIDIINFFLGKGYSEFNGTITGWRNKTKNNIRNKRANARVDAQMKNFGEGNF